MWTVNLILLAVSFGGALEKAGIIEKLFSHLKEKIDTVGGLVAVSYTHLTLPTNREV